MNTTISDRYELGDRLGSGGMSTVYRATDRVLERTVAVKILAEHLSDDEKFVARFRREALAVAKLIHPNIVQVYDTGVDADRHYIVMEYVEGKSGAQLLQTQGRARRRDRRSRSAIQACAGLEYAHRQGIIHRDVKPGNLMVIGGPAGRGRRDSSAHEPPTGEMTVKLTDFGIARASRADPADPGRLGRRHRRLPRARAGARRGGDRRPPTSTRSASSSTSCSPGACPGRARPSPSSRSGARTSARCRRPPTTPTSRRRSRARSCARSRATPRPLLARRASSRARSRPGSPAREPPPPADELPTEHARRGRPTARPGACDARAARPRSRPQPVAPRRRPPRRRRRGRRPRPPPAPPQRSAFGRCRARARRSCC